MKARISTGKRTKRRRIFTRHSNTSYMVDSFLDSAMADPKSVPVVREALRQMVESDELWDAVARAAEMRAQSRDSSGEVEDILSRIRKPITKRQRVDAEFIPKRKRRTK